MTVHNFTWMNLCRKALTNISESTVFIKDLGEEEWTDVWQYIHVQYSTIQYKYDYFKLLCVLYSTVANCMSKERLKDNLLMSISVITNCKSEIHVKILIDIYNKSCHNSSCLARRQ